MQGRFLRLPEVTRITGLNKMAIYKLMNLGKFPSRINISTRNVAWPEPAIRKWMDDQLAENHYDYDDFDRDWGAAQ